MKILILGNGGREHAIAQKVSESTLCEKLYIAPGNPGTNKHGENIDLNINEFGGILSFCKSTDIKMVIVGPELPLVKGIYDFLTPHGINVVGPGKEAAKLEGSKLYAKIFMEEMNIPTAKYAEFTIETIIQSYEYIDNSITPIVLKADGLAGGKGVVILNTKEEAKIEIKQMLSGKFGAAGNKVVIEEFLDGIEFSVFAITDGKNYKLLPIAKDYKRIGEGDTGLNTGGMGAISPVSFVTKDILDKVEKQIVQPTITGLNLKGLDYKGFVFIGLILVKGKPYVIEYNVRMGDPETEVVFPRIKSDIVPVFDSLFNGSLSEQEIIFKKEVASTIVLVSGGYPEKYNTEKLITGVHNIDSSIIFQAGTGQVKDNLVTKGGRVIAVTTLAQNLEKALKTSYKNINKISFEGMNYRKDIGQDLL